MTIDCILTAILGFIFGAACSTVIGIIIYSNREPDYEKYRTAIGCGEEEKE